MTCYFAPWRLVSTGDLTKSNYILNTATFFSLHHMSKPSGGNSHRTFAVNKFSQVYISFLQALRCGSQVEGFQKCRYSSSSSAAGGKTVAPAFITLCMLYTR